MVAVEMTGIVIGECECDSIRPETWMNSLQLLFF